MPQRFVDELQAQLGRAAAVDRLSVVIVSGDLNAACDSSGGLTAWDVACLEAMEAERSPGDEVLVGVSQGAAMTVRYSLPRCS